MQHVALLQIALRAIVGSIAHDDSLVTEVRQAFEELEHGHAGSVRNSILLQVLPFPALPCPPLLLFQAFLCPALPSPLTLQGLPLPALPPLSLFKASSILSR